MGTSITNFKLKLKKLYSVSVNDFAAFENIVTLSRMLSCANDKQLFNYFYLFPFLKIQRGETIKGNDKLIKQYKRISRIKGSDMKHKFLTEETANKMTIANSQRAKGQLYISKGKPPLLFTSPSGLSVQLYVQPRPESSAALNLRTLLIRLATVSFNRLLATDGSINIQNWYNPYINYCIHTQKCVHTSSTIRIEQRNMKGIRYLIWLIFKPVKSEIIIMTP